MTGLTVPKARFAAQNWVISSVVPDFTLLDVWALPVEGRTEDADHALRLLADVDPVTAGPLPVRLLFAVRLRLGALLGWDDEVPRPIPGCAETTVATRLPDELRGTAQDIAVSPSMRAAAGGFVPLYRTADEWAAEISNATVHGILHLSWARQHDGMYRGQLAVYVKPRGRLGAAYLALIEPFRRFVVYPMMMREIERRWQHPGHAGTRRLRNRS